MAKTKSAVALTSTSVQKLKDVSGRVSNGFTSVTAQNVLDAILAQPTEELIEFVNRRNRRTVEEAEMTETTASEESSRPSHVRPGRLKKFTRVDPNWRAEKLAELSANGTTDVTSKKEAVAIYNFLLRTENVKVSYKKEGKKKFVVTK